MSLYDGGWSRLPKTDWFGMDVEPVRDGIYELQAAPGTVVQETRFSRWENGQWHLFDYDPERAARWRMRSDSCYSGKIIGWRGLTRKRNV